MEELSWRERGRLWLRLGLRLVLVLLLVAVFRRVVPPALRLLMPFVVALVLTWLMNPAVSWLEKRLKLRRGAVSLMMVLLVIASLGALAGWMVYSLVSQVLEFLQDWQSVWDGVMAGVTAVSAAVEEPLQHLPGPIYARAVDLGERLVSWLSSTVPGMLTSAAGNAGSFAMTLPALGVSVIICVMATYFISADYPNLRARAVRCVPEELRGFCAQVKRVASEAFGGYVRAEFILSVGVFFILLVGFFVMKQPYALLLAFVLAVMDFIPIIGAGTVMVPWAVIDVILGDYRHAIAQMIVWGVIVLFRRLAEPKIVGDQTGLSPIASLVSIYVGMKLGGVLGMILGPVVCLIFVNMTRGGLFENTVWDLRMALRDVMAILKGGRKGET